MRLVNFLSSDKTNGENNEPNLDHLLSSVSVLACFENQLAPSSSPPLLKLFQNKQIFFTTPIFNLLKNLHILSFTKTKRSNEHEKTKFPEDSPGPAQTLAKNLLMQNFAFPDDSKKWERNQLKNKHIKKPRARSKAQCIHIPADYLIKDHVANERQFWKNSKRPISQLQPLLLIAGNLSRLCLLN